MIANPMIWDVYAARSGLSGIITRADFVQDGLFVDYGISGGHWHGLSMLLILKQLVKIYHFLRQNAMSLSLEDFRVLKVLHYSITMARKNSFVPR